MCVCVCVCVYEFLLRLSFDVFLLPLVSFCTVAIALHCLCVVSFSEIRQHLASCSIVCCRLASCLTLVVVVRRF
jgi:hypothetical protein